MAHFNRNKTYNFWHSPLVLLVLFCVLILFAYNMIGLIEKERETSKKKEIMLSQIEALHARESNISTEIEKLKTEEGVEETIRDKFQVTKQGEKMVIIVDEDRKNEELKIELKEDHSFWGWIKRTIFNH